jgi:hypothetical protein
MIYSFQFGLIVPAAKTGTEKSTRIDLIIKTKKAAPLYGHCLHGYRVSGLVQQCNK